MTTTRREVMAGGMALASVGFATLAQSRIISPSPEWTQALPPAPVAGTKITPEYAQLVGRDAYFWAWPLVNLYIRRLVHEKVSDTTISGSVPVAPLNQLGMLSDYIAPEQRLNPCPNQRRAWQDVRYHARILSFCRPELERRRPEGNYQDFSRFDQYRIRHAACLPRRQPGRQQGRAER